MTMLDIARNDLELVFEIMDPTFSGDIAIGEFVDRIHYIKNMSSHTLLIFMKHQQDVMFHKIGNLTLAMDKAETERVKEYRDRFTVGEVVESSNVMLHVVWMVTPMPLHNRRMVGRSGGSGSRHSPCNASMAAKLTVGQFWHSCFCRLVRKMTSPCQPPRQQWRQRWLQTMMGFHRSCDGLPAWRVTALVRVPPVTIQSCSIGRGLTASVRVPP